MSKKVISVAICGCGARGADTYGALCAEMQDKYKIKALLDPNVVKVEKYGKKFNVDKENRYQNEEEFFSEKRADLLIIATLDAEHTRQCIKALELGYDILLEKPITDKKEDCEAILAAQKKYGGKVIVCHVLRYAPAFLKAAELLQQGVVGRLVNIQAIERVGFWHQAHSYVRGNWRRSEETTPMILAKCCHDLDLLQYYANSACKSISSIGELTYFTKENAPEGAAERCVDCKYKKECAYSAERIYIDWWRLGSVDHWPQNVLSPVSPLTEEILVKALKTGPYGRCIFACDNNVVDHQLVNMTFENGVKASLTMTAFSATTGRVISFFGTEGELVLDETQDCIKIRSFKGPEEIIKFTDLNEKGYGHGGGDFGLISMLYDILSGNENSRTNLVDSIESHLMGICAEESRLKGGELIYIHS